MGRTLPTARNLLDSLEAEWSDYRRGLDGREQARFDALWQKARAHASSMANQSPLDPMQAVFLGVLLEQAREIEELQRKLASTGPERRKSANESSTAMPRERGERDD